MEEVIEILKLIQNTSSLNEKQRILRENKDNELLKKCLVFLLDGNTVTGISTKKIDKMTISKAANYATFEPKNFSEVIDYLKTHNTGTDVDVATVRKFICNNSKSEAECQFYEEMVTKKFRLGADSKLINKAIPGLIEEFNVQLGTSIEKVKLKGNELIYISRKLNGLRCAYIGTECRTRQNKKINGVDHIIKDLQAMGYDNMFVDGELLYKNKEGLSDSEAFQKGTGIANSKSGDKSQLKFVIFDMFPLKEFWSGKSKEPYSIRSKDLDELEEKLKFHPTDNIEVVPRIYHGYDHSKIWEWLQYAEDNDWEGCCINLDKPYECKRTKSLITINKKTRRFPRARIQKRIPDILKFTGGRLKVDRHYPRIREDLERYLIQGLFDADGCLTFGRRKDKNRIWQKISFTSQLKILEGVQQYLIKKLDISTILRPKSNEKCYVIEFANRIDVLKFLKHIYPNDSFIILKRKYLKYKALRLELEENGEGKRVA